MKPVIIIALAFVLLIPIMVFAQEESLAEIAKRLDAENLEKAKQTGSIMQPTNPNTQQQSLPKIDCPKGTYQGLDNQKNPACRDVNTNQIVDPNTGLMYDSQTGDLILDNDQTMYVGIGIFVLIIIIAVIAKASQSKSSSNSETKPLTRRGWTDSQHKQVLNRQDGKCAICGEHSGTFQFDHKDDNHNNNDLDNCQALCPNCHDRKSRHLD